MAGKQRQFGVVFDYDTVHGVGAVRPLEGGEDIRLSRGAMLRSGLHDLPTGQPVIVFSLVGYRDARPFAVFVRPTRQPRTGRALDLDTIDEAAE